jgi:predicted SprT family Zn-dependent metalloprotease
MEREEVKKMALSRDCHCVLGKDRDTNFNEVIDKVFDYFESELKKLRVTDVSICSCGSTKYYSEQYKDVTKYYCSSCHEKIESKN